MREHSLIWQDSNKLNNKRKQLQTAGNANVERRTAESFVKNAGNRNPRLRVRGNALAEWTLADVSAVNAERRNLQATIGLAVAE